MAAFNPIEFPLGWDTITAGGLISPGVIKSMSGFDRGSEFDIKKGKGALGASVTFTQRPPIEGSVTFQLWEPGHFDAWKIFSTSLKVDPTKKTLQAIDVYHPAWDFIDLRSVVCKSIGGIKHVGKQLYEVVCEFLEYAPPPPKSAVGSPAGSKANTSKSGASGKSDDPIADAQQAEIAKLLKLADPPA